MLFKPADQQETNQLDPKVRDDFPIFHRKIQGQPIIYFDNAATTQKPQQVIDALTNYYSTHCSNIYRGAHALSTESTELYNAARCKIARFINADEDEIVFVRNTTEGINLVSQSLQMQGSILTNCAEHHSNFVPWFNTREVGILDVNELGVVETDGISEKLTASVALVAISHVSNVFSLENPIQEIIEQSKRSRVMTLIDAAQSAPHMKLDVKELDCDFLVFSGHKMLGPTGIGVLYVKKSNYDKLRPYQLGGGNVQNVSNHGFTNVQPPLRFEAGTPNIEGAIALGAAIDYLNQLGMDKVQAHSQELMGHAISQFRAIKNCRFFACETQHPISGIAFQLDNMDAHMIAKILNTRDNIMIRAGFHCAEPLHAHVGIGPTARASFYVYNTKEEVEIMANRLKTLAEFI